MNSRILGKLIKAPNVATWKNSKDLVSSKEILTPIFGGKKSVYRFAFDENDELTMATADVTLEQFFKMGLDIKSLIAEKAFENWKNYDKMVGYLDGIETYSAVKDRPEWMENALQNSLWLKELTEAKLVWNYIQPTEIIITKDRYKKEKGVYIQIICTCAWQKEHGLQIVLKNGKELIRVSEDDGSLFDYDDENEKKREE